MPIKTLAKLFCLTILAIVAMNLKDYFVGVQHPGYYFNILIAWMPIILLIILKVIYNATSDTGDPRFLLMFGAWLLFFPNSAYLILDPVLHIRNIVDLIAYIPSCILGVALAVSMFKELEDMIIVPNSDELTSNAILATIFYIISFGVYLGLFGRWNSWDLFTQPVQLISWAAANRLTSAPFCITATICLEVLYLAGKKYLNPSLK